MCLGNSLASVWLEREKEIWNSILFLWHHLPPNSSHVFKHVLQELEIIHSFPFNMQLDETIAFLTAFPAQLQPLVQPPLQRGILLSWALFYNFKGPRCCQNSDKFLCQENFPMEIILISLIFWAQMEPSQDLVTHLVCCFDEQRQSICHHDSLPSSSACISLRDYANGLERSFVIIYLK